METATWVNKCLTCAYEFLTFSTRTYDYVGRESEGYCRKCRAWRMIKIIREATLSDKLKPHMPWEGPPVSRGFLPAWPWVILAPLRD